MLEFHKGPDSKIREFQFQVFKLLGNQQKKASLHVCSLICTTNPHIKKKGSFRLDLPSFMEQ